MSQPVVETRALTKKYTAGQSQQIVLNDVNLTVEPGQFIVILGRSGSGKSTLLNLLGAMELPTAGEIVINGTDIAELSERDRTAFRRRSLGFIFQSYNLLPTLTVAENVRLPLELNGSHDHVAVETLLTELSIAHKADAWPATLSGGEQQRVAIARALIHRPELILADEPTGNLDIDTGQQIIDLVDDVVRRHGRTLIMATHSREVVGYADRVLAIREQNLVDL